MTQTNIIDDDWLPIIKKLQALSERERNEKYNGAEKLRNWLKDNNIKQTEFCKDLGGMDPTALCSILKGRRKPSARFAPLIEAKTGIFASEFRVAQAPSQAPPGSQRTARLATHCASASDPLTRLGAPSRNRPRGPGRNQPERTRPWDT